MRSYEPIDAADLERLADIAAADRRRFFRKRPEYADRYLCAALCQGAGQHCADLARGHPQPNGVKDLDVWSFFAAIPGTRFPAARRLTCTDFGPSKFGPRRVDLLLRALPVTVDHDPVAAIRAWLREGRTASARALAAKGVVMADPSSLMTRIVWPLGDDPREVILDPGGGRPFP